MKDTLKNCPKCGAPLNECLNTVTQKHFYKCSNKECHFNLRKCYYEEEIYLQGLQLNTTCGGCGKPLEIAEGPFGLYARCFNCTYDLKPTIVDGNFVNKWANARSSESQKEINDLIIQFKSTREAQKQYGFDEYEIIETKQVKMNEKSDISITTPELYKLGLNEKPLADCEKIVSVLKSNLSKPFFYSEIFELLKDSIKSECAVINHLKTLRNAKIIKIVGFDNIALSSATRVYYQLQESPLPEAKVYRDDCGYSSISSFFRKEGTFLTTHRTEVARRLRLMNEPFFLIQHDRGFCTGYKIETLKKLYKEVVNDNKEIAEPAKQKINIDTNKEGINLREEIIKILKKNLNKGYSSVDISKMYNISLQTASDVMRRLANSKDIKIVEFIPNSKERYIYNYQLNESALPEVKVSTSKDLISLKDFYNKNRDSLKIKNYDKIKDTLKKANIKDYPFYSNNRVHKGYKKVELEKLLLEKKDKITSPIKAKTKENKNSSNKPSFFSRLFHRNKKSNSEIIYF